MQRPRQSQFCVSYRIFCFFAPATLSIAWLMVSDCTLLASDFLGLPPLERGLAAGFWVALALAFAFAAFVASAFVLALFAGGSSPSYAELFRPNHSTKSERFALHSMKKNYYNTNIEYIGRISYSNIVQHRPYHITSQKIVLLMAYGHLCLVCS